ncbi:MAG: hypothetical protein CM1200mP39_25470 [Dehalococcoidia bacterium]|nr:MAG: hypothetical protein CM1200mP39_25470 [Dehalococcoidia bacterium]
MGGNFDAQFLWVWAPGDTSNTDMFGAPGAGESIESIKKRWPKLQDFEMGLGIEHTWGGVLGVTRNTGHVFGQPRKRDLGLDWCNGANVGPPGTMSGALIADMIVGNPLIFCLISKVCHDQNGFRPILFVKWLRVKE